ncbi:MAG TPA: ABC transporter permease, partial [Gemmatimonadaceae bacterium]|nr:ABC transporter permease [Gemmatimonadaceae bacterium]
MRISRHDLRLAVRSFTRHPGFSATAVVSLALAIALNTTMYSVIDAMVSPKTDVRDPDRVFTLRIWGDYRHQVDDATRASLVREASNVYEEAAFSSQWGVFGLAVEYGKRYQGASGIIVAPNYFHLLGIAPIAGRTFVADDVDAETQPVMISSRLAETLFPDGESPISKVIDVDGDPHPVIGVIRTTSPNDGVDLYTVPAASARLSAFVPTIFRLRKRISAKLADMQLRVPSARFAALAGETTKDTWFQLSPLNSRQFHLGNFHYALIAAVVAVLLIACSNLANLQLARGIGRGRELALRIALGAVRRDIIAQLVLESALLSAVGLIAGLLLTWWGVHLLASRIPPSMGQYVIAPQTSWRVLVFAVIACVVCVMFVGLVPAIRVSRVDPNVLLKLGAGTGATKKSRQQYGVMVVVQVGLALALLSGAGVVVRMAMFVNGVKTQYDLT